MAVKIKGPVNSVRNLLSGSPSRDTMHGGLASAETKRKVAKEQQYVPRQKPSPSGAPPAGYDRQWRLAQQPQSGE
jgi:hypothetical protein